VLDVAWLIDLDPGPLASEVAQLRRLLDAAGLRDVGDATGGPRPDVTVVWADRALPEQVLRSLAAPGTRCVLAGPTLEHADPGGLLGAASGLRVLGATPVHDIRLRATPASATVAPAAPHSHGDLAHTREHEHLTDRVLAVEVVPDDVEVLRVASLGLAEHPVMTWRASTGTGTWLLGATPGSLLARAAVRSLVQLVRRAGGVAPPEPVGVGLLGYGAIGHEHSRAVRATAGLELAAVCDTSGPRLEQARSVAAGIATTTSAEVLLGRSDVDLVVVSTPPSTHADWALRVLAAGKHLVVEKPFALTTAEADAVLAAAQARDLLVVVYQNRRSDPDHLALRRVVRAGLLGRVFHLEAFIGGYGHPCNLWHSDEGVSGGAFYDWGSHVIDQILDLVDSEVEHVSASQHKLRWFDVTNADHSRVSIRFRDGTEAEFVHSDLAAALKPRWYVLGTEGAVVGSWRRERVVSRSDIGTLLEDVLAPADAPPLLDLHAADGSVTRLATPAADEFGFHRQLADRLGWGIPMEVTAQQSRRVLAVMEAARRSAAEGSRFVVPR